MEKHHENIMEKTRGRGPNIHTSFNSSPNNSNYGEVGKFL
jgi:hypothetical protein